jgi:hypothetical protein
MFALARKLAAVADFPSLARRWIHDFGDFFAFGTIQLLRR